MKVQVVSDFHEYYDYMFDRTGTVFERNSINTISRLDGFRRMENMGLSVPYHDYVHRIADLLTGRQHVVVYTDQYAHRGEGKERRMLTPGLVDQYPHKLAALFVPVGTHPTISYRYLRIGSWTYWMRYTSADMWRSNVGDVHIDTYHPTNNLRDVVPGAIDPMDVPMLAIDFVVSVSGMWWAIDYNTSPGLRHTPVEEILTATKVVEQIKRWYMTKYVETIRDYKWPPSL